MLDLWFFYVCVFYFVFNVGNFLRYDLFIKLYSFRSGKIFRRCENIDVDGKFLFKVRFVKLYISFFFVE